MSHRATVRVWTLTLTLNRMISDDDLGHLDSEIRDTWEPEEPSRSFIWQRRGVNVRVRTEGNPVVLLDVAEWALLNLSGTQRFTLESMMTTPLMLREGWHGHVTA